MTKAAIKQAFGDLRPAEEFAPPRGGRPLALGGRLDRRHERHARRHHPAALLLRRRRLARPRADPDAGDPRRAARSRSASSSPRSTGSSTRSSSRRRARRAARYEGRFHAGTKPRLASAAEAEAIVAAVQGQAGEITKLETTTKKERAPLLYDLTTLQREANNRYGFSARRTLAAAQRLYEEHKALTYPRTNSRFLSTDMIGEIKPTAAGVGSNKEYAEAGRLRDRARRAAARPRHQRRQGHRPPRDHPDALRPPASQKMSDDDKKVYDMVVRRFLAVFHPDAVWENTRLETTVAEHIFRTRGRVLLEPGWRSRLRRGRGRQRVARRRGRRGRRPDAAQARAQRARRHARGRRGREGDQAAAALLRRVAAGGDGDRRQGSSTTTSCASR